MESHRVDAIYEEIGKYSVDLAADAWSLGPRHVHELISMTRGYLNAVSYIMQEILQERQGLDRAKHAAEASFRIESDRLLAEDDRVRRLPNIEDRKATVSLIQRDLLAEIQNLEAQLLDLSYVDRAVRHRFNELKSTMTDIRAQRALIRDAIDVGSFYGDETDTPRGHRGPRAPLLQDPDFSEDEIAKTMEEINAKLVDPSGEDPLPSAGTVGSGVPTLDGAGTSADDFADLIDGLGAGQPEQLVEGLRAPPDDFSDLIAGVEEPAPPPVSEGPGSDDPDLLRFLEEDEISSLLFD